MELLKEILLRLVTAPEDRLVAVKAVLDGATSKGCNGPSNIPKATDETATIIEAMAYFNVSRATVWRKVKAVGLREKVSIGGFKHYDRDKLFKAVAYGARNFTGSRADYRG